MQNIKLLIVEDDEDDFVLTKDLLDEFLDSSYQLDWVKDVNGARNALRRNEHDLCLMDYQLGSNDGIQLLNEVSGSIFSGPIIMLTGLKNKALDSMALKAGAVDYLVKDNLTRDQLERAMRYALARRETELERVERLKAESANRAKSEFLAHLSHELRTPLTAILGYSDMLYKKVKDLEDKAHLQIIHQNGKHLLGLLNDVLDLSKIEAGKLEIEKSYVELEPFFTDIYMLMDLKARDKNLDFSVNFLGELYPVLYTDQIRLRQVVINLISNAIKFTQEGDVRVDISNEEDCWSKNHMKGECLHICVTDTGVGIDEKKQEKIFQPFIQVSENGEMSEPGTGLGLTISRELVQRMGGRLTVESQLHKGSKFHCFIQLTGEKKYKKRKLIVGNTQLDARKEYQSSFDGRVLVVDDLLDIRRLIGHIIATTGVEVIYAENGIEAVEMLETAKENNKLIDLILMDIQMPHMNGRDAARRMRNLGYARPIIALTASSMKGDKEKCLESGFTDFLGKPVEATQLYKILEKYLPTSKNLLSTTSSNSQSEDTKAGEPTGKHSQETRPEANRNSGNILIVEDNEDALNLTALLVHELGWNVEKASSALEALQIVEACEISTVLFDINLPDMNGYELVDKIRAIQSDINFIAVSGEEPNEPMLERLNIQSFLLKPINIDMITSTLQKLK